MWGTGFRWRRRGVCWWSAGRWRGGSTARSTGWRRLVSAADGCRPFPAGGGDGGSGGPGVDLAGAVPEVWLAVTGDALAWFWPGDQVARVQVLDGPVREVPIGVARPLLDRWPRLVAPRGVAAVSYYAPDHTAITVE